MEMYGQCNTSQFYLETIDSVIQNVAPHFYDEGYDDEILQQLKALWLNKLQTGKQNSREEPENDSSVGQVDDGLTPEVSIMQVYPNALDSTTIMALSSLPQEVTSSVIQSDIASEIHAYDAEIKEEIRAEEELKPVPAKKGNVPAYESEGTTTSDTNDSGDNSVDEDAENAAKKAEEEANMDESSLNSDDDLTDDGLDNFTTDNLVMCQYSKITRVRNKWRFNLSHGIMFLNGEEYVFSTAKGETQW